MTISGHWDDPYSVIHITTLAPRNVSETAGLLAGHSLVLPSLAPGKHVVHLAAAPFATAAYKWKLLGLQSC